MHLVYIDDSHDEAIGVFSALVIPIHAWQEVFQQIRSFRKYLKTNDGIYIHTELHAWKFVSGRGHIADCVVTKWRRCEIFKQSLQLLANTNGIRLFNAVFPTSCDERGFERLLNRINRTMQAWDSHAILISDEGKEAAYTRLARKMHVYNPIPSQYGTWQGTKNTCKNIPIERIIEDPFFKDSQQSYLIQMADFCAYSLLRREKPLPSKTKYGLDEAFNLLKPILVTEASTRDPEGIIRL